MSAPKNSELPRPEERLVSFNSWVHHALLNSWVRACAPQFLGMRMRPIAVISCLVQLLRYPTISCFGLSIVLKTSGEAAVAPDHIPFRATTVLSVCIQDISFFSIIYSALYSS